jgi:guanine deaminase
MNAGPESPETLVGTNVAALGGEPEILAATVALAEDQGLAGQPPFAAVLVRNGVVIGAGTNTVLTDRDPAAHAEVNAVRDASRRQSPKLVVGSVIYSSCEPCAICRTVAAAAGVAQIVYAAGRDLVPLELDASPQTTAALADAVSAVLPSIARRGQTSMTREELSAPFRAYVEGQYQR